MDFVSSVKSISTKVHNLEVVRVGSVPVLLATRGLCDLDNKRAEMILSQLARWELLAFLLMWE